MSSEEIRVQGDFPVHFRYTVGITAERFFREIKENGRLIAARCRMCELSYLPPRLFCERCMSRLEDFVEVENIGSVEATTVCHRDGEGNILPEPIGVALVRFPGVHGGLVHKIRGSISVGDRVRVVFKDKSARTGSILDIDCFEKA